MDEFIGLTGRSQWKAQAVAALSQEHAASIDPASICGRIEDFAHWANSDSRLCKDDETTAKIKASTATTTDCQRAQLRSALQFFGFIMAHPSEKIRLSAEMVPDDSLIDHEKRRFIILTRGLKTPANESLVSGALAIFAVNAHRLSASKEGVGKAPAEEIADTKCKPGSLGAHHKHLFAFFSMK